MLTSGSLNVVAGVRHAFFSRRGGISESVFTSLNCGFGSGDDPDNVAANRARAMERLELDPQDLLTVYQTHSPDVVEVDAPWRHEAAPRADAMVTTRPGLALGILSADCAPVLLADGEARVIGAAHAGWRGALAGVIEATVGAMVRLGARPERLVGAIGPCIALRSYEVGPEFPAPFLAADPGNRIFFAPGQSEEKMLFDLRGYVTRRLESCGVARVTALPHDTLREERFFSYRRACLAGERDYGRGLSAIALVRL